VTLLGALGCGREDARLVLDTRNATGALGDIRHVIKI